MTITLLTPNFVLAHACATDQGRRSARGCFGAGGLSRALLLLSPLVVRAAGRLWSWEGGHDILETRTAVGAIACAMGVGICGRHWFWFAVAQS